MPKCQFTAAKAGSEIIVLYNVKSNLTDNSIFRLRWTYLKKTNLNFLGEFWLLQLRGSTRYFLVHISESSVKSHLSESNLSKKETKMRVFAICPVSRQKRVVVP